MINYIEIPTNKEFNEHHEKCFNEMPKDILIKAVQLLKEKNLTDENIIQLQTLYNEQPIKNKSLWFIEFHSYEGRYIRNFFRENDLLDEQLPSGNWDDYYTQVLECAIGVREIGQ
jgi:hypothetical protein